MYIIKTDSVQNRKNSSCWSKCSRECLKFRKTISKSSAPSHYWNENLVLKLSDGYREDRGTMSSTTDCMSPDHMLLATHSDHRSRSKLTVHNQLGAIPVMVGKTNPVNDNFGDDRNACWLFSLVLPESNSISAEHNKEEQSCYSGDRQGFLVTNLLGFVQENGISFHRESTNSLTMSFIFQLIHIWNKTHFSLWN